MCKLIRFFYLLIPIHGFRAFLIQKHFERCSGCQMTWGMDQSMHGHPTKPEWVDLEHSLWPRIQERIQAEDTGDTRSRRMKKTIPSLRWRWALAGSGLLLLIGVYFVLHKSWIQESPEGDVSLALKNPQVHIIHAEIHGKKAKPFIFHTQENLFIWFDEINQEED